jgi:hypothetical protein
MRVPTETEWGNYQADLDQAQAHKVFAGRTNSEMLPHFRHNVIERTDELRWMPEVPFRYYALGFKDFVVARDFERIDAPDVASCFVGLVLEKLENQPSYILSIMPQLLSTVRDVAMNQASFEAKESIYGSFREKLARIETLYESLGHMAAAENIKLKPGDTVVLTAVPPGMLDGLPSEDQQAITEIVGKPILLTQFDEDGRAELEFQDRNGYFHVLYVKPEFILKPSRPLGQDEQG